VRIATRDGVELLGDHYEPVGQAAGVLVTRGPYGRGMPFSLMAARPYVGRGYHVLFVSSRGTDGSGGDFDPMRTEADDGQDVVAWLRRQAWFPGRFGTVGGSYLGHTQWAMLSDPPPELAAAVISIGPHDFARHAWGTGTFNLDFIGWSDGIVNNRTSGLSGAIRALSAQRRLRPVIGALPLVDAASEYFSDRAPWVRERLVRPDLSDPYWAPMRHADALERADIPILLVSGWQDLFIGQTVEQFRRLRERGIDVAMTVGPWTHIAMGGVKVGVHEALDWLDDHLAQPASSTRASSTRSSPVRVFVTGADEWRDLPSWPPPSRPTQLYLHPDGTLADSVPTSDSRESSLRYDPADPTPTVGGPLIAKGGYVDDGRLAARPDVLSFLGGALDTDLDMLGTVVVHLAHRTERPDADLFVRLSDVDGRGTSHNVTEGYLRLAPDRGDTIELSLLDTAYRFRRGHRIRLLVAGGSFPQFARNLGTGENPLTGATFVTNQHFLAHADGSSWIALPTVAAP
jgi:putative CocE/NonD family hydrolase